MEVKQQTDETVWRKKFGNKLKRLIHIAGMTQGDLASELDISEVTLSRYITGTCSPSLYRTGQIARILKCDINVLCDVDK